MLSDTHKDDMNNVLRGHQDAECFHAQLDSNPWAFDLIKETTNSCRTKFYGS